MRRARVRVVRVRTRATFIGETIDAMARQLLTDLLVVAGGVRPLAREIARRQRCPTPESALTGLCRDMRRYGVTWADVRAKIAQGRPA